MLTRLFRTLICATIASSSLLIAANQQWNWNEIDVTDVALPKNFLVGTAIAEYQNSGAVNCPGSNWAYWEERPDAIKTGERSGVSCDFWNQYPQDIKNLQAINANSLRFSVDWTSIEPTCGNFNQEAINHYVKLCDALLAAKITPMVTLHHFVHPMWFEKMGGFEKEENIIYFVRFCTKVFEALSDRVTLWGTINEPTVYVLQGYFRGVFPPGKSFAFRQGAHVLKNLLKAHCAVYEMLKSMDGGKEAQIGLVHQALYMKPFHDWLSIKFPATAMESLVCGLYPRINALHTAVTEFLKTGHYRFAFGTKHLSFASWQAPKRGADYCDFIGINYYSRAIINILNPMARCLDNETMTDMQYAMYPQGLYEIIKEMAPFGKPMYITENGVANRKDDIRETFIRRYTYAMSKAISEGCDVRGYYWWTLVDNFEWDEGKGMEFGLFEFDPVTQKRTLKPGAACFKEIAQAIEQD